MRQTSPAVLAVWALVGLVLGWLLHPLSDRWGTPPIVTWAQVVSLGLVAGIVALAAWSTWRTVQVLRERLEPQQAVNRLVLARACAFVGAFVGGGYLGYGLSWIGDTGELADERLLRSSLAAVAGLCIVIGALLLERACRVRKDDPSP